MSKETSVIMLFIVCCVFIQVSRPTRASHACIIGAGSSGLGTARYMKELGLNFKVFEATRHIGGIWRHETSIDVDEDGLPTFPTAYKGMRINSIKEITAFYNFPFPESLPSFITMNCVYKHLQSFVKHFVLMKHIQFQSLVTSVDWTGSKWNLTYMKTDSKRNVTEECDFVTVASGEYSKPYVPHFEGQEVFRGKIIHTREFRDPEDYRNQRVLAVGAGPSGFDVAGQLYNITSKFFHSHHYEFTETVEHVKENYIVKPDIKYFTPTGAVFVDGTTEEFDFAILCTGYTYNMPFLKHETSGLAVTNQYVMPLYKQVVNINHPSMTFVGIGKLSTLPVRDIQGHYVAYLVSGKVNLPTQQDMFMYWFEHAKNLTLKTVNTIGYQSAGTYSEELLEGTDISRPLPVFIKLYDDDITYFITMFTSFREYQITIINETDYTKIYKPTEEICTIEV